MSDALPASPAPVPTDVVFDFGAVLFHWSPSALVARHWPERAPDAAAARALAEHFFGGFLGDWAEFDRGLLDRDAIVESVWRRTGLDRAGVAGVVDGIASALQPDPHTVALLHELQALGLRAWFLSNMPAPYAAHLRQAQPVLARFDGGLFSCEEKLVKPEPALFERLVRRYALSPERTVLIDDAAVNVQAARALGWQAVHYQHAGQARDALRALGLRLGS